MTNPVIDAIKTRRSIRKYKAEQITDEELVSVLEAGTFAPTGKNKQEPFIVAVQDKTLRRKLADMNMGFMSKIINPYYNAPTIVLVFAPKPEDNKNSVPDGSLILGTMMIAAHSIGLGSCWINREREMFATKEGLALMKELGIPENYIGIGALALGYPAVPNPEASPRKADYYKIIK